MSAWLEPRTAYIHVPFCAHHCGYCDFAVTAGNDHLIDLYLEAIATELATLGEPRPVESLFIGGGTPTHLSADQLERLLAAVVVDMDGEILPPLLAHDAAFPAEQSEKVGKTIDHARQMAGAELLQKSRWLFAGLHWWMRGRYGVGTAGQGLLKDPAALKSADVMFGLLMPINPPIPNAPTSDQPVPLVDRRHHYLWQFETQKVTSGGSQGTNTSSSYSGTATVTTTTHFY